MSEPTPEKAWEYKLAHRYGLTVERYTAILEEQDGRCPICKRPLLARGDQRPHVDHDHLTGEVRGILCHRCNVGVGWLEVMEEFKRNLQNYLGRYQ